MPSKVQIKLLSNSGELLSLITCHAGKISVLRAASPNDLRPYQRALSGASAKDNLEVVCDGAEYRPDQHTLIGFGEPAPTFGLSVKQFLTAQGVSDLATESLLLSIGLEMIAQKQCSELTPDQEARLRLVAATTAPEKILVLNEPFENVASHWRERAAEMLSSYASSRKALIIIPALSYRPESWIDNETIERIEVGQTSQRTIGFGSAGSQSSMMAQEIRAKLQQDQRFADQIEQSENKSIAAAAAMTAGLSIEDLDETAITAKTSILPTVFKVASVALGVSAGGWLAVSLSNPSQSPKTSDQPQQVAALHKQPTVAEQREAQPQQGSGAIPEQKASASVEPARIASSAKEPAEQYVLDSYPALIKTSLIDTSRGLSSFGSSNYPVGSDTEKKEVQASGNLFSLLEKAGSKKPDSGQTEQPWPGSDPERNSYEPEEQEDSDDTASEQERREAIRQRFLEAIQAAAKRRQEATMEASDGED